MQTIRFIPYTGETGDLTTNENHLVFKWIEPSTEILFSVTKKQDAAQCHLLCSKGVKRLKEACREFVDFVFYLFDWCKMILIASNKNSINRLLEKLDFDLLLNVAGVSIYRGLKNGRS